MDDNKRTPDDSYKDLLDIYAREEDEQKRPELKNMVERNRKSGKKPFKLEIKDLDSEFTDAPQKDRLSDEICPCITVPMRRKDITLTMLTKDRRKNIKFIKGRPKKRYGTARNKL